MTSNVYFRMKGTPAGEPSQAVPCLAIGTIIIYRHYHIIILILIIGIKLLDLKREIIERKNLQNTTDFDLQIVDEGTITTTTTTTTTTTNITNNTTTITGNGTQYVDDDEVVPKNASVVARRIPVKAGTRSIVERIRGVNSYSRV